MVKRLFLFCVGLFVLGICCFGQVVTDSFDVSVDNQDVVVSVTRGAPIVELHFSAIDGYYLYSDTRHLISAPKGLFHYFLGVNKESAALTLEELSGLIGKIKHKETLSLKCWENETCSASVFFAYGVPAVLMLYPKDGDSVTLKKSNFNNFTEALDKFEEPFPFVGKGGSEIDADDVSVIGTLVIDGETHSIQSLGDLLSIVNSITDRR